VNQQAPTKLFREEAKTGAIDCPACGAPITLHGFGGAEQVVCVYCGTVCKPKACDGNPEADGLLDIVQRAERARQKSMLELYERGEFDGHTWEIIGIAWRQVVADGSVFPWQEFLLFNPYEGYRWLIYQMHDGVWSIGGPLAGAVEVKPGLHPVATWQGESYKHFTSGNARVTYVEGEFPWRVLVGDVAQTHDYICPPKMISVEVEKTGEDADLNFTQMRPISSAEVWAAFKRAGVPPSSYGIHPAAPNPYATKFYLLAGLVLGLLWLLAVILYTGARDNDVVFNASLTAQQPSVTQEIQIGEDGEYQTVELELTASGMVNSWAYTEVMLVDVLTEEAIAVGIEVDAYSGVDSGESWSEGTNPNSVVVGGVRGGKYILQAQAQIDSAGTPAKNLKLTVKRDVPVLRYIFVPLLFIAAFPLINLGRRMAFEGKRWASSDHAPSSE
jgi:transcription initiation factor TFIIIB Brf1 subunit/transcription initiation factor TFIIB